MVMVKPALAWLDVVRDARLRFNVPLAAYNVSGEYSMVKGGRRQWLDRRGADRAGDADRIRRAGADLILTYHAKDAARWLARRSS